MADQNQEGKSAYNFGGIEQRPPPSAINDKFQVRKTAMKSGADRLKSALKSNVAAGFPPGTKNNAGPAKGTTQPLMKKPETEEDQFKNMEREINSLIEQSASANLQGQLVQSLELAKDAWNKEKTLRKIREQKGMVDQINYELTFCTCINLANQQQTNKLYKEALNMYTMIVKNKNYPNSGRLRVNIGNIYFGQKNYQLAIKMYRMALDSVNNVNKEMKIRIMKNIGHSFIKLGEFQDAIDTYENIMESQPDFQTGFNLIVCNYALGDYEKMKKWFNKLISIEIPGTEENEEETMMEPQASNLPKLDPLKDFFKEEKEKAYKYITQAAKLLAPVVNKDIIAGYDYVLELLKANGEYPTVESELEMAKALYYIRKKEYEKSIEVFKGFEKKEKSMMAIAANNISFLYFMEKDYENADKYSLVATQHDRYNSKALVNRGNCFYMKNELESAKEHYLEAIGVEANCVEAIYNLGLVNKKLGLYEEALQAFDKVQSSIPGYAEVLWQLGNIYEILESTKQANKFYNILVTKIQSDPSALLKIGSIYNKEKDELQALHFHQESYRYLPSNIETISWLGIYFAKTDLYEKAIHYFERAALIQPNEVKWRLMVATCYRKMNAYQQALKLYQEINTQYPENIECLRYLVMICKDLGLKYDNYSIQLKKLERAQEKQPTQEEQSAPPMQQNEDKPQEQQEEPQKVQKKAQLKQEEEWAQNETEALP
jgi:intraflagellar transport protein 88